MQFDFYLPNNIQLDSNALIGFPTLAINITMTLSGVVDIFAQCFVNLPSGVFLSICIKNGSLGCCFFSNYRNNLFVLTII
jgi:hypothetical protein